MALMRLLAFAAFVAFAQNVPRGQSCTPCHDEQITDFLTHKHAKQFDCGICHGPSEKHRASTGTVPPDRIAAPEQVSALCGNCHLQERQHYESAKHFSAYKKSPPVRTANCSSCHGQHANRPAAALERNCARCHTQTPSACKGTPTSVLARVACMGCHASHKLSVHGQ